MPAPCFFANRLKSMPQIVGNSPYPALANPSSFTTPSPIRRLPTAP